MQTQPPDDAWSAALEHLKRANDFKVRNELERALEECDQASQLAPDWAEVHYLRGLLLQSLGRTQEALQSMEVARQLGSDRQHTPHTQPDIEAINQPPPGTDGPRLPATQPDAEAISQMQRVPWTNRDAWWGLVVDLIFYIPVPLALVFLFKALSIDLDAVLVLLVLFGPMTSLLAVWWFTRRKYGAGLDTLGFRRFSGSSIGIGCGMLVAAYVMMIVYGLIITALGWEMDSNLKTESEDLSIPTWLLPVAAIVVAPVVEEVFFRGFLFAGLRQRYGWMIAAMISSGVFSALHLLPLALPPLFMLGFLLAYLYHRSNSIWVPILMHAIYNSFVVIITFAVDFEDEEGLIDLLISL